MQTTLIISDLHCPFEHPSAVKFLSNLKSKYKPSRVVAIGDEVDAYAFSKYLHEPEADGPARELAEAIKHLQPIYKLFPNVLVCESNHTMRPYKRAAEAGLPGPFLKPIREVLQAPVGWKWASEWRLDGVLYTHGDGFSGPRGALTAAERFRCSSVIGHLHCFGGIQWSGSPSNKPIFGMNVGSLVDQDSIAMGYARHMANRPVPGCGVIVDGVPNFIPLT